MKKDLGFECQEDKDIFHHLLEEQIAYISVKEEEERIREELRNGKGYEG
ncbi:hypothetical protein [Cytobacillus dafuensis]|nr:hypothetical protein [Cytobacillus dafuensis]